LLTVQFSWRSDPAQGYILTAPIKFLILRNTELADLRGQIVQPTIKSFIQSLTRFITVGDLGTSVIDLASEYLFSETVFHELIVVGLSREI
jgi:hypothetical protein